MTLKNLYDQAFTILTSTLGEENSSQICSDIYFLLSYLLKQNISELKLNFSQKISCELSEKFFDCINRRVLHEPVQYIIGLTEFFSQDFIVNKNVLIPRIDSEVLVENVLKNYKNKDNLCFLDLCCGTGCLGISVLLNTKNSFAYFVDYSDSAIKNTISNLEKHQLNNRSKVIKSDLFNNLESKKFDFIISNPPYIETSVLRTLALNISMYEPKMAFDGGVDGLDFYRKIGGNAHQYLKPKGKMFLETSNSKAKELTCIFSTYKDLSIIKDYCGQDRVLIVEN